MILTARHNNQLYGDVRSEECQKILQEKGVKVTIAEIPGTMLSYRLLKELMGEYIRLYSDIDGVFMEDITAYCFVSEARELGIKVPQQLKIIGYDGNEIIKISSPRITTIEQNIPLLARTCVEQLMRKIAGEETDPETLIPVRFAKGGTT